MRMLQNLSKSLFSIGLIVFMGACSDSTNPGDARLTVLLTDAPGDYIGSAEVSIGEVWMISADGDRVMLTDDAGDFELLDLQNGVTASLASLDIPAGTYVQARMVVNSAMVTLADGFTFNDGTMTRTLTVPSGMQSGIKINLTDADGDPETPGVEITGDMVMVFDFDVQRNFRIQGSPHTPAGIRGVHFQPLIRAVVRDIAGSISGAVTDQDANALPDQIVKALLLESGVLDALQTPEATGTSQDDGTYSILYLAPGTYEVSVIEVVDEEEETLAGPDTVMVGEREDVTDVDFVVDQSGS